MTRRSRREQAPEAARPELEEADPPVMAVVLVEQQRRDEEAAEGEEHVDAEVATGHAPEAVVVEDHGDDGDGTEAVEPGAVAPRPTLAAGEV